MNYPLSVIIHFIPSFPSLIPTVEAGSVGPGLAGPAVLLVVRPEAVVPPAAVCRVAADVRVMCKDTIK